MSTEENKAAINRINVELNKGNLGVIDEYLAPDFVGHSPFSPELIRGPEGYKAMLAAFGAAMPDLHYPSWTLIAEGDFVVTHMAAEGTFTNPWMGLPPNDKKVVGWMANIWRFAGGKAVEWWMNMDTLGFMQQLGAIPPMGGG
jgi:predicted ester cyclase